MHSLLKSAARQRQRWDDHQILPHVNWGDLFFDLFYVAAAYNLAVILKESPSWDGFLYFVCCYVPLLSQWNEKVIYDARFAPEDNLFHRAMEVLSLLILGTAIQHIRPVELMQNTSANSTTFVFSLCLVLLTVLNIHRHQDVHQNVVGGEEAKHQVATDISRLLCCLIPYMASMGLAGYDYFLVGGRMRYDTLTHPEIATNHIPILLCLVGYICQQVFGIWDVFVVLPRSGRNFKEIRVPMNIEFTL